MKIESNFFKINLILTGNKKNMKVGHNSVKKKENLNWV